MEAYVLPLNKILTMLVVLLSSLSVYADEGASNIRLVGSVGFGSAGAENEGVIKTEEPLALGFSAEYSMNSRFTLGFEHNRSWQTTKSNIGATGIAGRWYLWAPHGQYFKNPSDVITETAILHKGYIPYLGLSTGFAQSSLPRKTAVGRDVSVAKAYLSGKFGVESPISGPWGWRSELSWTEGFVGEGSIRMVHLFFGFYYFL